MLEVLALAGRRELLELLGMALGESHESRGRERVWGQRAQAGLREVVLPNSSWLLAPGSQASSSSFLTQVVNPDVYETYLHLSAAS